MCKNLVFYLTFFFSINLICGQQILFYEDFNGCELSDQWSVNIVGNQNVAWSVGIPENPKAEGISINGTCMLVIDDDFTGDKTDSFNIRFTSAYFDGTSFSDLIFKAKVHFRRDKQEFMRILIDNGKKEYLLREFKDRNYSGNKFSDYVDISSDLSFIASDSMRIILEYDDSNAWGWWAGVDDISVTGSKDGEIVLGENFNDCALPDGWSTEILNGVDNWNFGVFNDGRTIDGSCFVNFNDDKLGVTAPLSKLRIYSPTFNASEFSNYKLTYDLIYRTYEPSEYLQLYVDNGKEWLPVKIYTTDFGGPEVDKALKDSIDLSAFRGDQIRLIWEYNDGGWAWWVGFDNVKVTAKGNLNDRCNKSIPITLDGGCLDFDNSNALSTDDLNPNNSNESKGFLYYTWKSAAVANYQISTQSSFNDQIEIWEGTCDQSTKLQSINRDEYGFTGENIIFNAEANKDYIFRISGKTAEFGNEKGKGCISLTSNPINVNSPDSDQCLKAIPISKAQPCINASNKKADFDGPLPTQNLRSRADIWYVYSPQDNAGFEFKSNADFADALAVFKGSCGQLVEVVSEYSGQSITIGNVEIGESYYIQVSGYFSILEGNVCGQIIENQNPIVLNDDCVASLPVILNGQCTESINTGATYSGVRPSCDYTIVSDIWFSFVASSSNSVFIRANVDFEHILSVYEGSCSNLTSIYCNKNPHYCNGYIELDNLTLGNTYYVQIGSKVTQSGTRTGSICLEVLDYDPMWKPIDFEVNQECLSKGAVLLTPVNLDPSINISYDGIGLNQPVLGGQRYIIEGKDDQGCVVAKVVDTQTCNDFGCTMAATIQHTNTSCFGLNDGSASFDIVGGLEPYNIRWSNGRVGAVLDELVAGSYQVTITDGSACELVKEVIISQPSEIIPNPNYTLPLCFGDETGSISLFTIGGVSPYQYNWSNGAKESAITNIPSGSYTLTITDINNCKSIQSFVLTQPDKIIVTESIKNNLCPGDELGEISVFIKGGTGNYTLHWFENEGTSQLTNLSVGIYILEVVDKNNCIVNDTFAISSPDAFSLLVDSTVLQINASDLGYLSVTLIGGTPPYLYAWELNGEDLGIHTKDIIISAPGLYKVLVSDANGCTFASQEWEATLINNLVDMEIKEQLILLPNPVSNDLQIKFYNGGQLKDWAIHDVLGRVVLSGINLDLIGNQLNINVSSLNSGTYIYSCTKDGKRYTAKFVKL